MSKGTYLSVYLGEEGLELVEALDKLAKRTGRTRNEFIKLLLLNFAWLAGEIVE